MRRCHTRTPDGDSMLAVITDTASGIIFDNMDFDFEKHLEMSKETHLLSTVMRECAEHWVRQV